MKVYNLKTTLILLLIFTHTLTKAQNTITVNNTPDITADYKTLQEGIDAAKPGDTIYVQQSKTIYKNAIINKQLHIRGRSHSLKNYKTKLSNITFSTNSSGSSVKACNISILDFDLSKSNLNNILIESNYIFGFIGDANNLNRTASNITLRGNIIAKSGEGSGFDKNFLSINFTNNICSQNIGFFNDGDLNISNNIFFNGFNLEFIVSNTKEENLTINNCIFINNSESNVAENGINTTYNNCITYNYNSTGSYTFANDDDTKAINCLDNTDPKFKKVNTTSNSASIAGSGEFNPKDDDVHLQSNAPKTNVGVYWIAQ